MNRIIILLLLLPSFVMAQPQKMLKFSFTLPQAATVSAGVFKGDVLVRSLFNNKRYAAGTHSESMVALDDEMKPIITTDSLTVKVLSNNVKYEWEGIIGNTSAEKSGSSKYNGYYSFWYMQVWGNTAYYAKNYEEAPMSQNLFSLNNIQSTRRLFPAEKQGVGQSTIALATDGNYVYWAGPDPFARRNPVDKIVDYVFATKVADNSEVDFAKGTAYKNALGRNNKSVIDFTRNDSSAAIKGIAVQKTGKYLFVSRGHAIHVIDKISGELIRKTALEASALAVDMQDNLWVVSGSNLIKFSANNAGEFKELLKIPGFAQPVAVGVSPDNKTVVIADAGTSQQLKAFDNNTGLASWNFGQEGGYYKNATVTDDKFYFSDNRQQYGVSISYQKDGSFWLVDGGNARLQHYTANRKFIERIQYLPHSYHSHVDPNVPTRVFSDYLEFQIDYSKPLAPDNGSWKFVANWGAIVTVNLYDQFRDFKPYRLPNNKTYALFFDRSHKRYEVAELTAGMVLRFTGLYLPITVTNQGIELAADGNLYEMPRKFAGKSMLFTMRTLKGFDATANPIWGAYETIASIKSAGALDPQYSGNLQTLKAGQITSNRNLIVFDGSNTSVASQYHLGAVKLGNSEWTWRTARATNRQYKGEFPSNGDFDIGNTVAYPGGVASVSGKNIFWGYHGEFWKQTQTNKFNHVYENGLMVGQFGITGKELQGELPVAGFAGNVMSSSVVKVNNIIYLYHNDEASHGGVHRWKISNLESIKVETSPVKLADASPDVSKVQLMKGMPFNTTLINHSNGWSRFPEKDDSTNTHSKWWSVGTNTYTYNKFENADISAAFRAESETSAYIAKDLGVNHLNSWEISGYLLYNENNESRDIPVKFDSSGMGGQFFEILDKNGKVLFRFFPHYNSNTRISTLYANRIIIAQDKQQNIRAVTDNYFNFRITAKEGSLKVRIADYPSVTVPVFDPSADYKSPGMVRIYFWNKKESLNRRSAIKDLEFKKN